MPDPALGQLQLLTANGIDPTDVPSYTGHWKVHLPAITSPPGDGGINEINFTVGLPGHAGVTVGFYIDTTDGLASHFAVDQVLDSAALPAWVSGFGISIEPFPEWFGITTHLAVWDGTWTAFELSPIADITIDAAGSDAAWAGWATSFHIDSVAPSHAAPGATVVVTGAGFTGATYVKLGSVAASFTVDSDTQITAVIGTGSGDRDVIPQIQTPTAFFDALDYWHFDGPLVYDTVTPTHGPPGTTITISGIRLTGADTVGFPPPGGGGGPRYPLSTVTDTVVTAVIPALAPPVFDVGAYGVEVMRLATPGWGASGQGHFTVDAPPLPPTITGYMPSAAFPGNTVTILGAHFNGTTDVKFAGSSIAFAVVDDGHITFTVPVAAAVGLAAVQVTTLGGSITDNTFRVAGPGPYITSFSPDRVAPGAVPGSNVDIYGGHLSTVTHVRFGGTELVYVAIDDSHLVATISIDTVNPGRVGWADEVPADDDLLRYLTVTSPDGTASSNAPLRVFPQYTLADEMESVLVPGLYDSSYGQPRFLPLDATHTLVWGFNNVGSSYPYPGYWVAAVINHTDPSNMVLGTMVPLFYDHDPLQLPREAWVAASPGGDTIVATCPWHLASGDWGGTLAQVLTRSATYLSVSATKSWTGSADQPAVYVPQGFKPVLMSDTRLVAAQSNPPTAVPHGASFWTVAPAGVGTAALWTSLAAAAIEGERVDATHLAYQKLDGSNAGRLGCIAVTDAGLTLGSEIGTGVTVLAPETARPRTVRQQPGRLGTFRGYARDPATADILHVVEWTLDPTTDTWTGGQVAQFGQLGDPYNLGGYAINADKTAAFDPANVSTMPPDFDLDPDVLSGLVVAIGPDLATTGQRGATARIVDTARHFIHQAERIWSLRDQEPEGFLPLGDNRVATLYHDGAADPQYPASDFGTHLFVWRINVSNPYTSEQAQKLTAGASNARVGPA